MKLDRTTLILSIVFAFMILISLSIMGKYRLNISVVEVSPEPEPEILNLKDIRKMEMEHDGASTSRSLIWVALLLPTRVIVIILSIEIDSMTQGNIIVESMNHDEKMVLRKSLQLIKNRILREEELKGIEETRHKLLSKQLIRDLQELEVRIFGVNGKDVFKVEK